tara:strand:+ start:1400 stop:1519 length:120 start_codon:yes stop_codon:yes gene_type:complete
VSAYRDSRGRFRRRTGLDVLEQIGGYVLIVLCIYTALLF